MGLKTSLAACGAAFIAYQAFQNRQNLSDRYRIEKTRLQGIVKDKDNIQDQLTIIKAELARLNTIGQETQYRVRVFQKDIEPRLQIIKSRLAHLQTHLSDESATNISTKLSK